MQLHWDERHPGEAMPASLKQAIEVTEAERQAIKWVVGDKLTPKQVEEKRRRIQDEPTAQEPVVAETPTEQVPGAVVDTGSMSESDNGPMQAEIVEQD